MNKFLAPLPADQFGPYQASLLLFRAGFGGTWEDAEKFAALGLEKAVDSLVNIPPRNKPLETPKFATLPKETDEEFRKRTRKLEPDARRTEKNARRDRERTAIKDLQYWWLQRMLTTDRPLEEKMALFWHSHFASSFEDKIERVFPMWQQNNLFRKHALSPFPKILLAVMRDPAMLVWLDNASNRKGRPNENFARELMELFSTGVNQYTETDVEESARALTGWGVNRETWEFVFNEDQHDYGMKDFLGWKGELGGDDIARIICEKDVTSRFMATKLLEFFLYESPEQELVDEAVALLNGYTFALRPFLSTLFKSRIFYSEEARNRIIKSPVLLTIGAVKAMRVPLPSQEVLLPALRLMGQELFFPPDVNGWPGGSTWINSNTLLIRYNFANFLIYGVSPDKFKMFKRTGSMSSADRRKFVEAQRSPHAIEWSPKKQLVEQRLNSQLFNPKDITNHYVREFLQRPISNDIRKNYLAFSTTDAAGGHSDLDIRSPNFDERIKGLVHLIMSSPDYQLC